MRKYVEIEPNRWRFVDESPPAPRSDLPLPYVISDEMDAVEQVDGRFYTSKRQFRAVGRALGLTEVGNEKQKPKTRESISRQESEKRRQSLKVAIQKYGAGHRPKKSQQP